MTDTRASERDSASSYAETRNGSAARFRLTLGQQIALACMSLALLAVALVSTVDATFARIHLRDKLEVGARLYAEQLRRQLAPVIASGDAAAVREIFDSFTLDTDVAGIAAYNAKGKLIEGVGRYPDHLSAGVTPDSFGQDLFVVTAGIATKEGATGHLYVSLSKARIRRSQHDMMWRASGTAAVALLIALALAIPIARRLTRRLSRIIDVATSIAHGDFDQPAIEDGTRDEIGMLAGAVNTMSSELRRTFRELAELNEAQHLRDLAEKAKLETMVIERTSNLEESRAEAKGIAERFALASDAAGFGVWEWSPLDDTLRPDDQTYRLFDRSRKADAEPLGEWVTCVHADDRVRITRELSVAMSSASVFESEFRIVLRNGETRHLKASARVRRDSSGVPLRLVGVTFDITKRKVLESQLIAAAQLDTLTGLANRVVFMERLANAVVRVRNGDQPLLAVLFLDVDRFNLINDTLGHRAGDELLRQIARRLQRELRASDTVAGNETGNVVSRFGGDEFLLLINDLQAAKDATRIAERLLNALAPAYIIFGSEVHTSASIGIVTSRQGEMSAEEVVRNADVAMFEAKHAGRACSVVFNEAMHEQLTRHVMIETSLRRAIGTAELYLVYQPIVELSTGQIVSAEALVRWNHPNLGAITPAEFIPVAEESGLIVALGKWVQREACQALAAWRARDPAGAPRTISVNVSRAELALGRKLLDQLQAMLEQVGLPAECLQLEITEREVMRNPEMFHELMRALQGLGIKIAMDDFGTGTSSLGLLRSYPFNTIKIDQSFVKDLTTSRDVLAVIHATINLVENLGMESLAEGVEEPAQVAILQSLGCRYAQGYLFSRPMTSELLLDAIARRTVSARACTESGGEVFS
jgi:diguanylate cyclase (GGDEF)-like protein